MKQVSSLLNTVIAETLGQENLVNEDLSNIVDVGNQITDQNKLDSYVKNLVNHIGRVIFVDRTYRDDSPDILMDAWEYGSICEKIQMDLPDTVENPSWALTNGETYDPNVFNAPSVSAKFFNKRTTFEVDMSICEMQVKQSFSNATQLNAFISMIFNRIRTRLSIDYFNLKMRTINNFIASTIWTDYKPSSGDTLGNNALVDSSGVRAVNLLYLYKQKYPTTTVTAETCLQDMDFLKFAAYTIKLYHTRMTKASDLFNIGTQTRFTPKDLSKIFLLEDFASAASVYLQSDTFHDDLVALPQAQTVPYWQGTGTKYDYKSISSLNVKIAPPDNPVITTTNTAKTVTVSGILGVMCDRDALGVSNVNDRVTSNYNAKAEFTNYFYKSDAGYFNDFNENFVVFFASDSTFN